MKDSSNGFADIIDVRFETNTGELNHKGWGQVGRTGGGFPTYSEGFICRIQHCGRHAKPSRKDSVLIVGGGSL